MVDQAKASQPAGCALQQACRSDASAAGPGVQVAGYFLGEHLVKMGLAAEALHVVQVATGTESGQAWLLRFVEAKALWDVGRPEEARVAAEIAIGLAPNVDRRTALREELAFVLEAPG